MPEYGLFSDEGCVEDGFYSMSSALTAIMERYSFEDELEVEEICPDHEQQPYGGCEECQQEEDEENEKEEEDDEDE